MEVSCDVEEQVEEIDTSKAMVVWVDPEIMSIEHYIGQELGVEMERLKGVFEEAENEEK